MSITTESSRGICLPSVFERQRRLLMHKGGIKGVVKVTKQIWTCNLHLLMVIVMRRVMSPAQSRQKKLRGWYLELIEHPPPDVIRTFIVMIRPSLKIMVVNQNFIHRMKFVIALSF